MRKGATVPPTTAETRDGQRGTYNDGVVSQVSFSAQECNSSGYVTCAKVTVTLLVKTAFPVVDQSGLAAAISSAITKSESGVEVVLDIRARHWRNPDAAVALRAVEVEAVRRRETIFWN